MKAIFKRTPCLEPLAGTDIKSAADEISHLAYVDNRNLILLFNGVYIRVTPTSLGPEVVSEYYHKMFGV